MKVVEVVSPRHRLPLSPKEILLVFISVTGAVDPKATAQPEGLCLQKIQLTPLGIKPTTFWPVAQCLKQVRHHVPHRSIQKTDLIPSYKPLSVFWCVIW